MSKIFNVSFLLLFFISCNQNDCKNIEKNSSDTKEAKCNLPDVELPGDTIPQPDTGTDPDSDTGIPGGDLPSEAYLFEINAELYKFSKADEEKVRRAFDIIKAVVGSTEFRDEVINFSYKNTKSFKDNRNFSNSQIYQMILDGKETLHPVVDNRMNLELELYYTSNSTVGYTYANKSRIFLNRKFFDKYTAAEVAGNLFHEWLHKVGFTHDSKRTAGRDQTVPYALGYIMKNLGKNY